MSDDTRTAPASGALTEPTSVAAQAADTLSAPAGTQPAPADRPRPTTPQTADALVWLGPVGTDRVGREIVMRRSHGIGGGFDGHGR